ncbi:guanine permease, partial [Enterococcus hirae]
LICALSFRQVTGSVMIGILAITVIAMMLGMVEYEGFVSAPPSLAPTFMEMDIAGALNVGMVSVIFAFLFVDLFDTSGTLIGSAQRGGLL